jgi:DNA-binding transcriptional regulator GbsR (MarR family)
MFCVEEHGLPPIAGRILGWLMVCDPPEQSAGQIAAAIAASRASLATNLRVLTSVGFISRRTRPGYRTQFYAVDDCAWEQAIRQHFATLAQFRDITADGLKLTGVDSNRAQRLRLAHGTFAQILERFADLSRSASAQSAAVWPRRGRESDTRPVE